MFVGAWCCLRNSCQKSLYFTVLDSCSTFFFFFLFVASVGGIRVQYETWNLEVYITPTTLSYAGSILCRFSRHLIKCTPITLGWITFWFWFILTWWHHTDAGDLSAAHCCKVCRENITQTNYEHVLDLTEKTGTLQTHKVDSCHSHRQNTWIWLRNRGTPDAMRQGAMCFRAAVKHIIYCTFVTLRAVI